MTEPPSSDAAEITPGALTLHRDGPGYPRELTRLADPPAWLRARGAVPGLSRAVAIVGTRLPTPRGERIARALAAELARAGCVIVSGGAAGIDRAAHLGALDAASITVVVHASGLAHRFPAAHGPLFDRIVARGGCELSERDDPAWPAAQHFLARNRLIAALSRVVIVVEAPARSGALSTAAHARAVGIPVMAVPHALEVEQAVGGNDLVRAGARPCMAPSDVLEIVEGSLSLPLAEPLLDRIGRMPRPARPPAAAARTGLAELPPHLRSVLAAVEGGAGDAEAIVEATGLTLGEVMGSVAELEVLGLAGETLGGRIEPLG